MHLTSSQVLALTEETLRQFLSLCIPEGLYLDYKEALSGTTEKEAKREFLKDVTAFANAAGGQLFLGVKEPSEGVSIDAQLVGLSDGDTIAQDLERLASTSIDPRIPGLRIVPVQLANGRTCVIAHIPPSLGRPHMVSYAGHRSFYVRHSESSFPMTTHEVRESVLTSSSAEARARMFLDHRLREVCESIGDRQPALFLQAVPLIAPEPAWDVLNTPFENVIRGNARRDQYQHYAELASSNAPVPTIDGILGQDQREQPLWETEVHRTGYISLLYRDIQVHKVGEVDRFVLHSGDTDVFRAFCHMLRECLEVAATDVPYVIAATYLNAEGTCLWTESRRMKFSMPYKKKNIVWPIHLRPTGSDAMEIAERLALGLFNAFGFKEVVK
ncbi:MAG: ATP-binding protein [Sulfuritalea sp.]|nr:ATP-binding protein [Sulfuritalea sp.]